MRSRYLPWHDAQVPPSGVIEVLAASTLFDAEVHEDRVGVALAFGGPLRGLFVVLGLEERFDLA